MTAVLVMVGVVLLVGLAIYSALLPGIIVRKKTSATLGWTIATIGTGIIPGIIAALLYRYRDWSAGKAFITGIVGYLALAWLIVGVLWALGFDF